MATVNPFAAIMPPGDLAAKVADPPYDVVSREEAAVLAAQNPYGFMRVARAEIELSADTDPYSSAVYAKALENYRRLRREVPLTPDSAPHYYVYSLVMKGHRQTGIVAAASVDDYNDGVIKKHEKTRKDKEDDRTRHILTLRSQTGPVFLTHRPSAAVGAITERAMTAAPLFDFEAPDGVRHTGWRVPDADTAALRNAFVAVSALYIADGHHRAASASRARTILKAGYSDIPARCDNFLAVIFPSDQLRILPYNRVILNLNGHTANDLLRAAAEVFDIAPAASPVPERPTVIHMYLEGNWWQLSYTRSTAGLSPVERLDVSLLQDLFLHPVLGIDDPRTSKRIDFVGGIRGTGELEKRVDSGEAAVAFSMFPTTMDQLMAISDADQIMPPKSTWFEPKLRDGLFIHDI